MVCVVQVPETLFLLKLELADRTVSFEEARTAVASDMLTVGYVSGTDGQLFLNPPESSRLSPGDMLVALTTQDKVAASGRLQSAQRPGTKTARMFTFGHFPAPAQATTPAALHG